MEAPFDPETHALALRAEADAASDKQLLELEEHEDAEVSEAPEATGITSHVLACSSGRAVSKSSFIPPHTTDAVWTRVAFFDAAGGRLTLSDWHNSGPGNPYRTKLIHWTYNARGVKRALVLWSMNGNTWRSWASC